MIRLKLCSFPFVAIPTSLKTIHVKNKQGLFSAEYSGLISPLSNCSRKCMMSSNIAIFLTYNLQLVKGTESSFGAQYYQYGMFCLIEDKQNMKIIAAYFFRLQNIKEKKILNAMYFLLNELWIYFLTNFFVCISLFHGF